MVVALPGLRLPAFGGRLRPSLSYVGPLALGRNLGILSLGVELPLLTPSPPPERQRGGPDKNKHAVQSFLCTARKPFVDRRAEASRFPRVTKPFYNYGANLAIFALSRFPTWCRVFVEP